MNESRLAPFARVPHGAAHETELLTYVLEGALTYSDGVGNPVILRAGDFQLLTTGRGVVHEMASASPNDDAVYLEIQLGPRPGPEQSGLFDRARSHQRKRFFWADRHHRLCLVASREGRLGSLVLAQDVYVYSAVLDPGNHVVYELVPGRMAWLQVLAGSVQLAGASALTLSSGDGAGIHGENALSFTALVATEILMISLPDDSPDPHGPEVGSANGHGRRTGTNGLSRS